MNNYQPSFAWFDYFLLFFNKMTLIECVFTIKYYFDLVSNFIKRKKIEVIIML